MLSIPGVRGGKAAMSGKLNISVVIITYNEEKKIERCLKSVGWADEIIVVDSFSTDATVEICRRYTGKVYQHPWPHSSSEQRKIADRYARNDWILALDADEVVTVGLRDQIIDLFTKGPTADLYRIPRKEFFAGKWLTGGGWYPQYKSILYRNSMGEWFGRIHLKFVTRGRHADLDHPILHDGYVSFRVFMDKFNYYSTIEAEEDFRNGRRFSLPRTLVKPVERFFGRLIVHRGYRDGIHGLFLASVVAINYFLREMKLFELSFRENHGEDWEQMYRGSAVGADPGRIGLPATPAKEADARLLHN